MGAVAPTYKNLWIVAVKHKAGWGFRAFDTLSAAQEYAKVRVRGSSPRAYIYKATRTYRVVSENKGCWSVKTGRRTVRVFVKKG